ncbi:hypothetical protein G3480_03730 [Thiorhodococcus mannitoliphagus]|uniref:Uncharacterized protein n=1 Tax=Thiorhodococcus mannitoliphagus TaxID=329406 RepID=A0A6P1DTR4_9GAMM|nr:hypothetical protein [Thiorhodococcus mannitoliphagus]NEX19432.1 hypothetical protein [Thiorhodococcus mannitoliphagus]
MKPAEPTAPTPPPGGNIENRQPPAEPSPPARAQDTDSATPTDKPRLDVFA